MKRLAIVLGLTLALLFGSLGTVQTAAPAHAGNCTIPYIVCGWISNKGSLNVRLIKDWGGPLGASLKPGQISWDYYRDTDGFAIPPRRKAKLCMPGTFNRTCYYYTGYNYITKRVKVPDNSGIWTVWVY